MTFRTRLTLSYAIASATSLTVLALAVCVAAAFVLARSLASSVNHTAHDVDRVIHGAATAPAATLAAEVESMHVPDGVVVRINLHRSPMGPPPGGRGLPLRGAPRGLLDLPGALGLHPLHVALPGGGDVFVAPDFARVDAAARWLALGFLTLELLAAAASWFVGRRIARRAMGPIEAIRAELERFAGGDFTPRAIGSTRSQDLDALVRAYNGAAAQVANALAERARVEAEMRQFLGEAGHQMRTPLTVISGSLDLLDRAAGDDAAVRARTVPLMRTEAARLRRLVERLFTLARLQQDEPPQTEVVDVRDVVRDVVDRANAAQATLVSVRDVLAFAYVRADPDEVHDAVANLVENAAKYGRGHVTVALSNRDDDVLVRVIDDGPGISPDDRSRLFERFFRGENAQGVEGTGLGLAIAERAAARAGGAVALESSGPAGSTFRIAFPKFREFADRRTAVALD